MRVICVLVSASALAIGTAASARPSAEADVPRGKVSNQYICTFGASVSASNVRNEATRAAGGMGMILHTYTHGVKGFAVRLPAEVNRNQVRDMKVRNPKLAGCEQDTYVRALALRPGSRPKKPGGGGSGGSSGQTTPWGIARVGGPGGTPSATAWIIDTGIDLDHPDLHVDAGRSMSFIRDSSPDDGNGHGSHVSGIIGACNNSIGVVGVAPCATLVAVRVLDRRGSGYTSDVIAGVDYVGAKGHSGDVANMSLGGSVSSTLDAAVCAAASKGIRFTIAAGNEADNANNSSPARVGCANTYTVSAFDSTGKFAYFSNYGNPPIDWSEPGVSIYSTYKGAGYATLSGTSMAAPHLAGILLAGGVKQDGNVTGDLDSNPDKIGVRAP